MVKCIISFLIALLPFSLLAQEGFSLKVQLHNYENDTLLLAYYHGERQLIKDTLFRDHESNQFFISREESLDPGMYLVVMKPDMRFFQLIVDDNEQDLSLEADAESISGSIQFENAPQNTAFFNYLNFLENQRKKADGLREGDEEDMDEEEKEALRKKLLNIDEEVIEFQNKLTVEFEGQFLGVFLKANRDPQPPEFDGSDSEIRRQRFQYVRKHFFDYLDVTDSRLMRSPVLASRVNHYVDNLIPRHPDSISIELTKILDRMMENEQIFRFFLPHFVNKYARSNIIGMDAVYVHLIDTYYKTGKATWASEEQLKSIVENADRMRPTLIGKTAPDIVLQDRDGQRVRLHELEYDYTILYFWRPDCGHCRRYTPQIVRFMREFEDENIGLVTICTKFTDEVETCWKYIDDTDGTDLFLNLVDPFHRSRFSVLYNVRSTPLLFVLDADKEILSKRLSAEQLFDVVPMLMKRNGQDGMEMLEEDPLDQTQGE